MKLLYIIITAGALLISGCASASKINAINVGMTKNEVIKAMGKPTSVSAQGQGLEYLHYSMFDSVAASSAGRTTSYYVRLVNGRVDSYGRVGDFDSTQVPTVRIETDARVKHSSQDVPSQLQKLKELKDAGVLTEEEFARAKARLLSEK